MDDVKDYLKKLIKQDDVVVIGCSGGPDSICLFDILKNLQKEIDFSLICAHVNHNVRKESKNEQLFMAVSVLFVIVILKFIDCPVLMSPQYPV